MPLSVIVVRCDRRQAGRAADLPAREALMKIKDVMTQNVTVVHPSITVEEAADAMLTGEVVERVSEPSEPRF
jgi:CBS domain-containing protein